MASNLDRSLDEILDDKKKARRTNNARKSAPVGGVRKRSARIEQKKKSAPVAQPPVGPKKTDKKEKNDTKIQVSNLPLDVNETMLREYFTSIVGPIRKCNLAYKANGQSTGTATIEFNKPGAANVAFEQFNGRLVDNRPMKVEIIVDPTKVSLAERISGPPRAATRAAPKAAPKPVTNNKPKPVTNSRATGPKGRNAAPRGRGGRKGTSGSGAKRTQKTAEELDQEMADYYKSSENAAPAAAPSAADTAAMEDL